LMNNEKTLKQEHPEIAWDLNELISTAKKLPYIKEIQWHSFFKNNNINILQSDIQTVLSLTKMSKEEFVITSKPSWSFEIQSIWEWELWQKEVIS
jgi:hypothetical protein